MNFDKFIKEYNEIYKAYLREYHVFATKLGLSDCALNILYELRVENRGISQKELGEALSLSKQTVNSAIKTLEEMGIVRLTEAREKNRTKLVVFTEKGDKFAADNIDKIIRAENVAFDSLEKTSVESMLKTVRKYYDNFAGEASKIKF
ncbi:MAG: winged helix-turn-helix transcriptional regulator [Clostridia bacterium]|nr:winged helix-turn-helix transcriptional regulator [Clostridia bacterium]MDE7337524.1 winged helix-turn-helix transcriptional regulator [Clostridia bacterium]